MNQNAEKTYLMQQAYATLFTVTNKLQVNGDKTFMNLTSRQFMTLLAIDHIDGVASLSNVARKLGTTKQSVKQIIDKLEKQEYIVLQPSKEDKRALHIEITSAGRNVMEEYYELGGTMLSTWFQKFSMEDLRQFYLLLKKLYDFDGQSDDGFEKEVGKYIEKK